MTARFRETVWGEHHQSGNLPTIQFSDRTIEGDTGDFNLSTLFGNISQGDRVSDIDKY